MNWVLILVSALQREPMKCEIERFQLGFQSFAPSLMFGCEPGRRTKTWFSAGLWCDPDPDLDPSAASV